LNNAGTVSGRTTKPESEDRMKSARKILVTLHQPELYRRSRKVLVAPDHDGQLPPRLVDPVDRKGRVLRGEWTEPVREVDTTTIAYHWAGASALVGSGQELRTA
jgi:hypothetical protein